MQLSNFKPFFHYQGIARSSLVLYDLPEPRQDVIRRHLSCAAYQAVNLTCSVAMIISFSHESIGFGLAHAVLAGAGHGFLIGASIVSVYLIAVHCFKLYQAWSDPHPTIPAEALSIVKNLNHDHETHSSCFTCGTLLTPVLLKFNPWLYLPVALYPLNQRFWERFASSQVTPKIKDSLSFYGQSDDEIRKAIPSLRHLKPGECQKVDLTSSTLTNYTLCLFTGEWLLKRKTTLGCSLDLTNCSEITKAGLARILEAHPTLEVILNKTTHITAREVYDLHVDFPDALMTYHPDPSEIPQDLHDYLTMETFGVTPTERQDILNKFKENQILPSLPLRTLRQLTGFANLRKFPYFQLFVEKQLVSKIQFTPGTVISDLNFANNFQLKLVDLACKDYIRKTLAITIHDHPVTEITLHDEVKGSYAWILKNLRDIECIRFDVKFDAIFHLGGEIEAFVKTLPEKVSFSMCGNWTINESRLALYGKCGFGRQWQGIKFNGCSQNSGLLDVIRYNPKLKTLHNIFLNNNASEIIKAIKTLPDLKALSVGIGATLTPQDITRLARSCPNLESLTIRDALIGHDWTVITTLQKLRELRLKNVTFTHQAFSTLFAANPNLESLQLIQVSGYFNDDIKNLSKLKSLELNECDQIDPQILKSLITTHPHLQHLSLENSTNILPKTLQGIFSEDHALSSLNLAWCHQLTEETLDLILTHSPCLLALDVSGCSLLSIPYLKNLNQRYPKLKISRIEGVE